MIKWYCDIAHDYDYALFGRYIPRMHCHARHLNILSITDKGDKYLIKMMKVAVVNLNEVLKEFAIIIPIDGLKI